jgi:hypothetical protein
MKISSNSINRRSSISTNLSNKEKHPSMMKLQDQHITMITGNTTIPSMSIALISMVVGLYKIGKRTLGHLCKKRSQRIFNHRTNQYNQRGSCQVKAMVTAEAHSRLRTACIMVVTPTTTQKTAPYF